MCASRRDPSEPAEPPATAVDAAGQAVSHDVVVHRVRDEIVVTGKLTERALRDVTDLRGTNPATLDAGNGKALTASPLPHSPQDVDVVGSEMIYEPVIDAERGYDRLKNLLRRSVRRKPPDPEIVERLEAAMKEQFQSLRHEIEERDNRLQEANDQLKAKIQRLYRTTGLVASLGISVSIILIFMCLGMPILAVIAGFVGLIAIGLESAKWLRDPTASTSGFICRMGAQIAWALLAGILGLLLSSSAPAHPARAPVVRTTPHAAAAAVSAVGLQAGRRQLGVACRSVSTCAAT